LFLLLATTSPSMGIGVLSAVIFCCIILSALMSGSEVAFFSLNYEQRQKLKDSKKSGEHTVSHLLEKPKYLLATILIANNLFNIAIILSIHLLLEQLISPYVSQVGLFLINGVFITFILVLFGEIIPKVYANQFNLKFASFTARLLVVFKNLFYPFSVVLVNSTSLVEKRLSKRLLQYQEHNLDKAIDMVADLEANDKEKSILKGVVKFGTVAASQIMCPRVNVVAVNIEDSFDELKKTILESGYSRIPIYAESLDEIKGIIYAKDLLVYTNGSAPNDWTKLIKPSFFIPEFRKIDDLLRDFQQKRMHMAIVVDEYGGTSGIVTLEDVLEEVVGEIDDEYDNDNEMLLEHNGNGEYVFEGNTPLLDLCRALKINTSEFDEIKGEADTIAGLMLEDKGRFLTELDSVELKNYNFTVLSTQGNRIEKVKVKVK